KQAKIRYQLLLDLLAPPPQARGGGSSHDEDMEKLQMIMIELPSWYPHYLDHSAPYCPVHNRWFLILKSARNKETGEQHIMIRTGTLKHLFGAPAKTLVKATFQDTEDNLLELAFPTFQRLEHAQLSKTKEYGHLLVLMVLTGSSEFVVDLLLYDDEARLTHLKHLAFGSAAPTSVEYDDKSFSFDFNADRFFIQQDKFGLEILYGYLFTGDQFLTENVKLENGERLESHIMHHSDSKFIVIIGSDQDTTKSIKFFHINHSNEVIYTKTVISNYPLLIFENLIHVLDKQFIFGSHLEFTNHSLSKDKVYLYDLQTRKEHILHDCKSENSGLTFNWDLTEVAFVARHKSKMKLQIVRLPSFFTEDTLVNKARFVCLKSFTESYLRQQNLPKNLSQYLGLS
uniref:Uncharacterized protein n=1 Tax=Clytia hemisphaerica TaxID=252671 RepID=A0A7M5WWS4_9CNID